MTALAVQTESYPDWEIVDRESPPPNAYIAIMAPYNFGSSIRVGDTLMVDTRVEEYNGEGTYAVLMTVGDDTYGDIVTAQHIGNGVIQISHGSEYPTHRVSLVEFNSMLVGRVRSVCKSI